MSVKQFRAYPEYKDSGVEWLGEIPAHWTVKRADAFLRYEKVQVDPSAISDELVFHYSIPSIQEIGDGVLESPDAIDSAKLLIRGDRLLVSKLNPRKGVVLIASKHEVPTICSTEFVPFEVRNCELRWARYLFLAESTRQRLSAAVRSATRSHQRADIADIVKIWHGVPTVSEQLHIADFLDRETARIDGLVAKKERLIELLQEQRTALITRAVTKGLDPNVPMKDSGVEWLDQLPAHWTGLPLKRWVAAKITDGPHETPEFVTEGVEFVSAEAVSNGKIDFSKRRGFISRELHAYYCRKCKPVRDDILVCKSGATTGKLARVDVDFEFSVWSPLAVVRSRLSLILPRYLEMVLGSEYVQNQIKQTWSAGTQPNISMGDLERLYVVAPRIEEQEKILAYVDDEAGEFDVLIAKVRDAIGRLKELRTALISAAVTGKIDIREEIA